MKCRDNKTFVHEELWCDGYIHCPDGSDENPKECGNCQRTYGFPKSKKHATFSCKHKYTGRPICAVPCDGNNDLCFDDIDEQCSFASGVSTLLFGILLVSLSIVAGELLIYNIRRTKCIKIEEFELLMESNICLLNHLEWNLESPSNFKRNFGSFKKWHGKEQYQQECNSLSYSLVLMEKRKAQDIAQLFLKLESKYHHGNKASVHMCIRRNFGTNKTTKYLFKLFKPTTEKSNIFTKFIWNRILKVLKAPCVEYLGFLLLVTFKIFVYYTDMYKDIYMLVGCSKFVPMGNLKFSSFVFQVFIILIISVTIPMILNWFTLINARVQSRIVKFGILIASPLVPAISVYFTSKLNLVTKRIKTFHQNNNKLRSTEYSQPVKKLIKNNNLIHQASCLLTNLWSNENATEHLVQSLILILLIAVKFTQSRTVSGFQELMADGKNFYLLGLSAIISVLSIISGNVKQKIVQKNNFIPLAGIMIHLSYATLAMLFRVAAIVLYFAPAMGLFNLQMHWKMGKLKKRFHDQTFYNYTENRLVEFVWKPVDHYDELTYFQLDVYYISFLLFIPFHFLLVAAIKLIFSKEFKSRKDYWKKILHVIHQGNLHVIHQGNGIIVK